MIDQALTYPEMYGDLASTEKAFLQLGMSLRNVQEFTGRNMRNFNQVCTNEDHIKYASMGAKRREL